MEIVLKDDHYRKIESQVKKMFLEDFEIELSEFQTRRVIEFFTEELGRELYNQAVQDTKKFIEDKFLDLEGEIYIQKK